MNNLYFSYGSNMNLSQMRYRCPNAKVIGVATLYGWRLAERTHADIVRDADSAVNGVLWRVTGSCLRALDRYEGYPNYYDKGMVKVRTEDDLEVDCLTYWMADVCPHEVKRFSESYAAGCIEGALENGVPLDPVYEFHQELQDCKKRELNSPNRVRTTNLRVY